MDRRTGAIGPLNLDNRLKLHRAGLEPKPRRWPWLAILPVLFFGLGFWLGSLSGRATAPAWAAAHPCALAPGGTVKVEQAGGNGMLYTCSKAGEVMSRIPWEGGGVEP